ncbi:hypothetical protein BCL69_100966 [Nitrosomonas communis]|uniref:Uncharacterized protein n=2 Tax=Nitrosomonas communis TaxID=44574 RepID=A0A5D3YGK4_9PROT|nr:hypothetical protein BCL69_100966 [Nitrosomonas communis]
MHWHRLNQKIDMILIFSYLQKFDLIASSIPGHTSIRTLSTPSLHTARRYFAGKILQQYRNMIALMVIRAHARIYAASYGELNPKKIKRSSSFLIGKEGFWGPRYLVRAGVQICTDYYFDRSEHHPKIICFG